MDGYRDQRNLVCLAETFLFDYCSDVEWKVRTSCAIVMNLDSFVLSPWFELGHLAVCTSSIHQWNKQSSMLNLLSERQMNEDFLVAQDVSEISMKYAVEVNHGVLRYKLSEIFF